VFFILVALVVVAAAIGLTVRVVPETERAIVFRLGRCRGAKGPGPIVGIRGIDDVKRVTTKVLMLDVPVGEVITADDVRAQVKGEIHVRVVDPLKAVLEVENYRVATERVAHTVFRERLGALPSSALLHNQAVVNASITETVDARVQEWGVTVERAEIADVEVKDAVTETADRDRLAGGALRVDEPAEFGDF